MKRPALILICLLLQACSATTKELGNSLWDSLFGTPGVQLTDDDIQNMPYASQYMQLNGGPQLFVVLAFAEDGQQKWVTQDQATLVTQHGRLVKTLLGGGAGTVKVFSNGSSEAKTLTGAEYLIDLVGQPRLANSWWPGAVISEELATAAALRQQQALLTRLAELAADSSADDAAAINALRQQIQALKVTGRQKINLDPDIVRVAERGNPPLQGNYTLWVGPPPSTVTLFGLISRPGKQPFTPGRDVASYLSGQNLLSGADRSYAWVVYPDGRTQKAPVAYWNKRHVEPMPGSIIYVGLADSVWSETPDALNADILQTLTQRIPQ